jgi:hypothetical protein
MNLTSRGQRERLPPTSSPIGGTLIPESIPSSIPLEHHVRPLTLWRPYMVRPFFFITIVPLALTLSSDQIMDRSINLDPDDQRGTINPVVFPVHSCNLASSPQRCCLVKRKAHRSYRLCFSQLLHPPNYFWSVSVFPSLSQLRSS